MKRDHTYAILAAFCLSFYIQYISSLTILLDFDSVFFDAFHSGVYVLLSDEEQKNSTMQMMDVSEGSYAGVTFDQPNLINPKANPCFFFFFFESSPYFVVHCTIYIQSAKTFDFFLPT